MNAMVKVKKQGKARFIGTSTHTDVANVIRATTDAGIYDVVLAAYNYVLEEKEEIKNAIAHAVNKGVGVIAMKTQGGAQLQKESDTEINHQAALKWVLNDENIRAAGHEHGSDERLDAYETGTERPPASRIHAGYSVLPELSLLCAHMPE
jgi:predicted aldo/keto reductase-like oxidoreductase